MTKERHMTNEQLNQGKRKLRRAKRGLPFSRYRVVVTNLAKPHLQDDTIGMTDIMRFLANHMHLRAGMPSKEMSPFNFSHDGAKMTMVVDQREQNLIACLPFELDEMGSRRSRRISFATHHSATHLFAPLRAATRVLRRAASLCSATQCTRTLFATRKEFEMPIQQYQMMNSTGRKPDRARIRQQQG
jgi:hypothetical protein